MPEENPTQSNSNYGSDNFTQPQVNERKSFFKKKIVILALVIIAILVIIPFYFLILPSLIHSAGTKLSLIDTETMCSDTYSFTVKNSGINGIDTSELIVTLDGSPVSCSWTGNLTEFKSLAKCIANIKVTAGTHKLNINLMEPYSENLLSANSICVPYINLNATCNNSTKVITVFIDNRLGTAAIALSDITINSTVENSVKCGTSGIILPGESVQCTNVLVAQYRDNEVDAFESVVAERGTMQHKGFAFC
jgi:hypothetical protein